MRKFLAVIKREYVQRVRTRMFVVATILGPLMMLLFTVVPAYLTGINAGGPARIAVVDESGKMYERFHDSLLASHDEDHDEDIEEAQQPLPSVQPKANQQERIKMAGKLSEQGFVVERVELGGKSVAEVKQQLNERVRKGDLDAYVVIPKDILVTSKAEFYGRNTGDIFTRDTVESRLSNAVRDERLAEEHVPQNVVSELNRRVSLTSTKVSEHGEEKDSGGGFYLVFAFGFAIYVTTLLYGQMVLGAVVEEKETRIAELLFSSTSSFPLMMGKLIGVSLVALTQLAIWGAAFVLFTLVGVSLLAGQGVFMTLPHIPPVMFVYFALYFLLGYFIYATIYALVGSVVTTVQEGGQLALPVALLLVAAFCLTFPVARSPNSSLAFWASMFPFFAPITMLVRIVTETPPLWQILLSLGIGIATIVGLVWLASRIYRVGMLMTGKKATIPEVWRWVRQA
jgi:ABC-2 type transport system permease protein